MALFVDAQATNLMMRLSQMGVCFQAGRLQTGIAQMWSPNHDGSYTKTAVFLADARFHSDEGLHEIAWRSLHYVDRVTIVVINAYCDTTVAPTPFANIVYRRGDGSSTILNLLADHGNSNKEHWCAVTQNDLVAASTLVLLSRSVEVGA